MVDKNSSIEEKVTFVMDRLEIVNPTPAERQVWKNTMNETHFLNDFVTSLNGEGYFFRKYNGEISMMMDAGSSTP